MFFSLEDKNLREIKKIPKKDFSSLDLKETQDIEEWTIKNPELLGEDLLIVCSQYEEFEELNKRLDLLALDKNGKLVVIEIKRDKADATTDLQALKYASYIANITSKDIQKTYKNFWNSRDKEFNNEEVKRKFKSFLSKGPKNFNDEEDWLEFNLDNKPRIILVAGSFGKEITAPVVWLIDEYGIDITCIELNAYEYQDKILIHNRTFIPVPETEDYMVKRRQKKERQERDIRERAVEPLLDEEIISRGDIVVFKESKVPDDSEVEWDSNDDFWRAKVTGKLGRSNNVEWLENEQEYSFSRLAQIILNECEGKDRDADRPVNGYKFWCLPKDNETSLSEIRNDLEGY